jgi:hypothetical protein
MSRYRTQGLLAAGLGLLLTGCFADPDLKTDLRPEGPPEVLTVLALDLNTGHEGATFCKYVGGALDEKGPGNVQGSIICPAVEADFEAEAAEPLGWGVRIVFDELLNADQVETLDCDVDGDGMQDNPITTCDGHIDTTLPVTVTCEGVTGSIAYDGYYVPNGNKDSFPVGPSIAIFPDNVAATGTTCTVTIDPNVVVDKSGTPVVVGADINTFTMTLADLALIGTDPADAEAVADRAVIEPDGVIAFLFNAYVDGASISATDVTITTEAGAPVAASFDADENAVLVGGAVDLPPGNYTATLTANASIDEINGGSATITTAEVVRFVVAAP